MSTRCSTTVWIEWTKVGVVIYATCYNLDHSPRNENLNLLVLIKFLNLFLFSSKKKTETFTSGTKF